MMKTNMQKRGVTKGNKEGSSSTIFVHKNSAGFSTIELMIALSVAVVMFTGVVSLVFGGQTMRLDVDLTEEGLQRVSSNFGQNVAAVFSSWDGASLTDDSDTIYTHASGVTDISPCVKLVKGDVAWSSEQNRGFQTQLETLVASTTIAQKLGGDCDPFPPSANWGAPDTEDIDDPIFSGSEATDIDVIRRSDGRFALVTALHNPSGPANTLWMVDVTNLDPNAYNNSNPRPSRAYDTQADLFAVDATNSYAFVGGASTTNQRPLQVFDISNFSGPAPHITLEAEIALPNTSFLDFKKVRSVHYYNNKLYVGTDRMIAGDELHIYNVNFSPLGLTWETSIDVDRNVNDIMVFNNKIYLATGPGSFAPYEVMQVFDTTSHSKVAEYHSASDEEGKSLYVHGSYIFLGRERTTSPANHDFIVIDGSDLSVFPLPATDSVYLNLNPGKPLEKVAVEGVVVRGDLAFLVTGDTTPSSGGAPFMMFDVSDPYNIVPFLPCSGSPVNWSEKATGMDMLENTIFVSNESGDALRVIQPIGICSS